MAKLSNWDYPQNEGESHFVSLIPFKRNVSTTLW